MPSLPLTPISPGSLTTPTQEILDATPSSYGRAVFGRAFYGWPGRIAVLASRSSGVLSLSGFASGALVAGAVGVGSLALPVESPDPLSVAAAGHGSLALTPKSPGSLP